MIYLYMIGFITALFLVFMITPLVKRFALYIGAVDVPNARKVHTRIMPRLGGLAIYLAFVGALLIALPFLDSSKTNAIWGLIVGGAIIILLGALDDKYDLSPWVKLLGQTAAALTVVYGFGLKVDVALLKIPFLGSSISDMEWLSIPITVFWIVAVTNAINLIDGLDGLAAGVSGISTATILVMAIVMNNVPVILISLVLLGSILGFLYFNFHPARIFMGDSGALFLGFSIAVLSILGFKAATLVSFVVPLLIIGVPLGDTVLAILRRWVNKKPIFKADKGHLHHCLNELGFSHRKAVLTIYGISAIFGILAIVLFKTEASVGVTLVSITLLFIFLTIGAEMIGIISKSRRPVLHFLKLLLPKTFAPSTRDRGGR